jgi:hypothetical protein
MPQPRINPFIIGGPVGARHFFGRAREVDAVLDPVSNPNRGSVSIVGERRIGKTSLLHYVSAPDVIRRWNLDQTPSVFLFKDCGTIIPFSVTGFWRSVLKQFRSELMDRQVEDRIVAAIEDLLRTQEINFDDILQLVRSLARANMLLVLLLDEFEHVIRTESRETQTQTRDFLAGLRGLINQRERVLSLIVTTRQPLADLCSDIPFIGSPFFNNFVNVNLRPFSIREARDFIDRLLTDTGMVFSQREKVLVFSLAGTHPLLLQAAASCVFDVKVQCGRLDVKSVQGRYIDFVQHHLENLWNFSLTGEKEILTLLASGSGLASARLTEWTRERDLLQRRGLITYSTGQPRLFSSTFKQWLMDHLYELDGGRWQRASEAPPGVVSPSIKSLREVAKPVVFVSYSHRDEMEKDVLLTHLRVLEQGAGLIDLWSDDRIRGGDAWEQEIAEAIASASVAVLLISANFLTSPFILGKEVPELLRRREREGMLVIPVIAKPCAWQQVKWLAAMNVRPKNGNPVWQRGTLIEENLAAVAEEVATLIR